MSLQLRSEWRLRVGVHHGLSEQWPAGWARAPKASALVRASADDLQASLLATSAQFGQQGPQQAALLVEDEHAYFTVMAQVGSMAEVRLKARQDIVQLLGDEHPWSVDVTLLPCGQRWLVAAISADWIASWQEALSAQGVRLASVQVALLADLQQVPKRELSGSGVLIMVRAEGVQVLVIHEGGVVDVVWERCDVDDLDWVAARAHDAWQAAAQDADVAGPAPEVVVLPLTVKQQQTFASGAAQHAWRVLAPVIKHEEGAAS